ncbi:hypothetical protein BJV82DRAFT_672671 [Fennellomyces sp. T-0311]|nr:hypothetical protein BJV82DRAFT_672671 [Fennellomyces sp. T-0311]
MLSSLDNPENPFQHFDYSALKEQNNLVCKLMKGKQYAEATLLAKESIGRTISQIVLPLMSIQASGLAQQGQLDAAHACAESMINYAPDLATGYVRKGAIYSFYGQQTRAIEVFNEGLKMCKVNDKQREKLLEAKAEVTEISQRKVDFVSQFPREISDAILMLLSQETRTECLYVSRCWRDAMLQCKNAWRYVTLSGHPMSNVIMDIAPFVHKHFEHLTIDTKDVRMRAACLKYLRSNQYCSIHSLTLTASATQNFELFLTKFTLALNAVKGTLSTVSIDYGYHPVAATLADLLMTCTNLTTLSFSAANPRAAPLGDFSWVDEHTALVDLQVDTVMISGDDIKQVFECCRRLRRLVVNNCDHSVLDVINKMPKELQILGYNTDRSVPPLSSIVDSEIPGLRKIYTNDGGAAIPAGAIMPILYNNMVTLDTVFADIAPIPESAVRQFDEMYYDFRLANVKSFTFWGAKGIQPILLRAISGHTGLDTLSIVHSHDIKAVTAALKEIPPVQNLRISHVRNSRHVLRLVELFNKYAQYQEGPSLKSITLLQCGTVNDDILQALADIPTLEQVTLTNLYNITTHGLQVFLNKVAGRLTHLTLSEMLMVTDTHIGILRDFKKLTTLELDLLPNLTSHAFETPFVNGYTLKYLRVRRCPAVGSAQIHSCVRACSCTVSTE